MFKTKRALALALAGTMAVSNFAVASASELTTEDKLDVLMDLGIILGDSSNDDSLDLNTNMERYRSVVLMLRLTEEDENGFNQAELMEQYDSEGEASFADAGQFSSYVETLMAYTYNNDLGIDGYEDGTFRPVDTMTDKAYAKIMLESLGYDYNEDFTWAEVGEKAEEVGLIEDADSIDNSTAEFGEIVDMTYDTLASEVKGESITLGEKIGKAVVETELEVASVDALNLKQIQVTFNTAVDEDSATDIENYSLDADDADLDDSDLELVGDNTVVITLGTEAKQQETVTLTVENVVAENGKVLDETEIELSFLDQTIPTVDTVEVVGNETLKVTFSEPMMTVLEDNFEVREGSKKLYIDDVVAVDDTNVEWYVNLYNDLNEGEIDVTVDDAEDFAGFNVIKETVTVDVTVDEDAPEVVEYKDATTTEVTLVFDEDVQIKDSDLDNFYHTNSNNTADNVAVEGNEITLTFTSNELPEGTAYVYINEEAIADLWDNENDQIMIKVDVDVDYDAPVIEEVTVESETQIVIELDEALDEDSAEDEDNFMLVDADGEEVDEIKKVVYDDSDEFTLTVDFKEELSGEYTLFIEDVEDLHGNDLNAEIGFEVEDLTAPSFADFSATLYDAGEEVQIIKISFGEEMNTEDKYSVADEDNYVIDGTELTEIDEAHIEVVDNGESIEIFVPNADEDGIDLTDGMIVELARVADAAGNYTAPLADTLTLSAAGTVEIESADAIDAETIVITFDDELVEVEPEDLEIVTTDEAVTFEMSSVDADENSDGNTELTITLAEELDDDATFGGLGLKVKVIGNVSENKYGENIDSAEIAIVDEITPEVAVDADDNEIVTFTHADGLTVLKDTVTIEFTEDLSTANADLIATDLDIRVSGDAIDSSDEELVGGIDYTTSVSGNVLTIEFAQDFVAEDEIEINLDSTVNYLADVAGAEVEALSIAIEVE
ncbi:Ig-like domain-containing protein [Vallitalea okinawensis]|uniref:Ig-like domain-containing protein n=1 Tax=Vallitalea okinawensis TaxID=2078660 RepID=UPI000CFC322A|nr:Ig-like domain-containing protein [Vallitalea okinawensis]